MDNPCPSALPKREIRRQDRRQAILTVASRSFLEKGYAGTTMSAIAAELGGSKGTLWSYFPCKDELFGAVLDHETSAFRESLSELLDPSGELQATLRQFSLKLMAKLTSPLAIELHRLVVAECGRFPEVGRIFFDRAPRLTHELLARYLAEMMERGQLRTDDPLASARLLINMCMSGSHQKMLLGLYSEVPEGAVEENVDRAVEVFLRAYRAEF